MPLKASLTADPPDDENRLIAGAVAGDRAAFSRLYEHYVGSVYRYVYSRVADQGDAEDLTSQTFLRALKALPRYRHQGHFGAWLFTIARNLTLDHFRRARAGGPLESLANVVSGPDPAEAWIANHEQHDLSDRIRSLSVKEQELLRLRYVAGLSHAEIGRVLHRSGGAVKKSIYRILARLQRQMERAHE